MQTIADVLAAAREREGVAFDASDRSTGYSFGEFATTAWKAGNLLRHYGVRSGSPVGVVVGPKDPEAGDELGTLAAAPDPLLAALGATLLGGVVTFDPGGTSADQAFDGDALVAPDAWLDRVEVAPGCTRIAYGGPPDAPDVVHFEQATWSQNPVAPPEAERLTGSDAVLADGEGYMHGNLLDRARTVAEDCDLGPGDRVAVSGQLDGDVFAVGVLAPLVAGATIVGGPASDSDLVAGRDGGLRRDSADG